MLTYYALYSFYPHKVMFLHVHTYVYYMQSVIYIAMSFASQFQTLCSDPETNSEANVILVLHWYLSNCKI